VGLLKAALDSYASLVVSPLSVEYGKTIWDPKIAQNVTITASATASVDFPVVAQEPERPDL
jgi:hypothetical protein